MPSAVQLIVLALPALVAALLAGLAAILRVVVHEGRAGTPRFARVMAAIELLIVPLFAVAAIEAETFDVRGMFVFAALAYGFVGVMALRMIARYRE
jgi:hypothetical protein